MNKRQDGPGPQVELRHQAKDLLRGIQRGDPDALAEPDAHPPRKPAKARLAEAQLTLARSYGIPNWPRLVLSCRLVDAIWRDDAEALRALLAKHPQLLHESAIVRESNCGPPLL